MTVQSIEKFNDGTQPIKFNIQIIVKEKDIKFKNIYLKIKPVEEFKVYDKESKKVYTDEKIEFKKQALCERMKR